MTRPEPEDPVVIDSATGEWLPGLAAPALIVAGRGHAWQMVEGIWRLAEPEDDEEAVYRAVVVRPGRDVCREPGCVRTHPVPVGAEYRCSEHPDPERASGVDMSTALVQGGTQTAGTEPATTVPARRRRKEPDMPAAKTRGAARRARRSEAPMTNAPTAAAARKAAKATAVAEPTPAASGMRHCIGAPRFGIEPHQAPVAEFGKHNRGPDGLSRMCRPHWKVYAKMLTAAKLGPFPGGEVIRTTVTEAAPAAPRLATPEQAEKVARVRRARATVDAIDAMPAPEAVAAIGTDEAQEALATVATASLGTRDDAVGEDLAD